MAQAWQEDIGLVQAARRRLQSWHAARAAKGHPVRNEEDKSMSREAVIRRIVERDQTGQNLTEMAVLHEVPDLHQAAIERFGAWETALQYAGIDPRRLPVLQDYTTEYVLRKLQRLCRDGYSLKAADNMRRDRRLYDTARRYFGEWRKALAAAGVNLQYAGLRSGKPRRLERENTLEELRQWLAAGHARVDGYLPEEP